MTAPSPSESVNGKHWADILGCDVRAGLGEIQRAAGRRSGEAMERLRGPRLSERLLEIGEALDVATRAKAGRRRRPEEMDR